MKQLVWAVLIVLSALRPSLAQMGGDTERDSTKKSVGVEAQIEKLSDEGREAALKGDTSFLEKQTTDDYTSITGTGTVLTRSEIIQMRKSGDIKYSSIDVSDRKVRLHGNAAIFTATADVKGTLKGNDISGKYRIGQVWVKRGGTWKIANIQSTKVQEPGK
jgi:ketosteroid isomerase-like protein